MTTTQAPGPAGPPGIASHPAGPGPTTVIVWWRGQCRTTRAVILLLAAVALAAPAVDTAVQAGPFGAVPMPAVTIDPGCTVGAGS